MSLTSFISVDGILRAPGVAEEDIEAFRTIRSTLADATWGLISRIYNEYRALTPEQRTAIRQNLIQGARQVAHELQNAASNEDIHRALRTLAAPMPQRALPGSARGPVMIEELAEEESVVYPVLPPQRAITSHTPSSTRSVVPYSSVNDDDAALALALQVSAEENDAQLQAALQASLAHVQPSSSSSSSSSSSAHPPATSEKEGQKFKPRSAKRSTPEKPSKVATTPTYDGEGSDDPEFKKAMEEALAASLKTAVKSITPGFDHKSTKPEKKDDQDDDATQRRFKKPRNGKK